MCCLRYALAMPGSSVRAGGVGIAADAQWQDGSSRVEVRVLRYRIVSYPIGWPGPDEISDSESLAGTRMAMAVGADDGSLRNEMEDVDQIEGRGRACIDALSSSSQA